MISACAASPLHSIPSHSPFPPCPRKCIPLLSAAPLRYHPLFSSTPFVPLLIAFAPSVRRFSRHLPSFSSFVRPSFAFPFLFSRLSLSFPSENSDFSPASLLPSSSGSVYRFLPFFLLLVGQFHPHSIRAAHCSRVSRIAEVKPSDDFLAGTWFRALLFSSLSLCLFSLSAFIVEAVVTVDQSQGTRSVDCDETSERGGRLPK